MALLFKHLYGFWNSTLVTIWAFNCFVDISKVTNLQNPSVFQHTLLEIVDFQIRISLPFRNQLVMTSIAHELIPKNDVLNRLCDWRKLLSEWQSHHVLAGLCVSLVAVSVEWLQSEKSSELTGDLAVSEVVAANTKGRTVRSNEAAFSAWAAAARTLITPWVFRISNDVVVGFEGKKSLRSRWSNKWNKTHRLDQYDNVGVRCGDIVEWNGSTCIRYSIFDQDGFLDADWHTQEGRKSVFAVIPKFPTPFAWVLLPGLVA